MDFKQFNELLDKVKLSKELIEMNDERFNLRKYLNTFLIIKDKFKKGEIANGVNICIEPLNRKYGTNFRCDKDEDFIIVLNSMIKYIDEKITQTLNKKIEEDIIKKIMNY